MRPQTYAFLQVKGTKGSMCVKTLNDIVGINDNSQILPSGGSFQSHLDSISFLARNSLLFRARHNIGNHMSKLNKLPIKFHNCNRTSTLSFAWMRTERASTTISSKDGARSKLNRQGRTADGLALWAVLAHFGATPTHGLVVGPTSNLRVEGPHMSLCISRTFK